MDGLERFVVSHVRDRLLQVPRVPSGLLERPRLSELLDDGSALLIVRGACGTGKTVAVRDWALRSDSRVVWLNAHEATATHAPFGRAMVRALAAAGVLAASADSDEEEPWARLAAALREHSEPLTVVVDDAASANDDVLMSLVWLLRLAPHLRVVALENRATTLDGAGIPMLVDRSEIGPLDLMFTEDEVGGLLAVPAAVAQEIHASTGGFPVIIDALAKGPKGNDTALLIDHAIDAVEEFMRSRVAESGYDAALIDALVRASVAPYLNREIARSLVGDSSDVVLDEAERAGFGTWSGEQLPRRFHLTPFAKTLLRRELDRRHPDEVGRLNSLVVQSLLATGQDIEALETAVGERDLPLAAEVVGKRWYPLMQQHSGKRACESLQGVPLAQLREEPLLVMFLAICFNAVGVRRVRGLQLFRVAVSAANSRRGTLPDIQRLLIWTAESAALRLIGLREQAGNVALRALKVVGALSEHDRETYYSNLPPICAQLGMSLYYAGQRDRAVSTFEVGAAFADSGSLDNGLTNLAMLAGIAAIDGDLPQARDLVTRIREGDWLVEWVDGYQGTFYRIAAALLALESGDTARARQEIDVFEPHRKTSEHWVAMATIEAVVSLAEGNASAAAERLEAYAAARSREAHRAGPRRDLSGTRALVQLALGDVDRARRVLEKDASDSDPRTSLARARLALVEGRPSDALRVLSKKALRSASPRERSDAAALRTAALLRSGNAGLAAEESTTLAAVLSEYGLTLPLTLLPPEHLEEVRAELARQGLRVEVSSVLPSTTRAVPLSPRERVVLEALMTEMPLPAIADLLNVSPNTIKSQLRSLYRKLDVSGREEAVATALARGLLQDDSR